MPDHRVLNVTEILAGMKPQEIAAVNVVLQCLLCPRFGDCETARQLVAEPLLLVEDDQAVVRQFSESY